jgi:hypothetical protein
LDVRRFPIVGPNRLGSRSGSDRHASFSRSTYSRYVSASLLVNEYTGQTVNGQYYAFAYDANGNLTDDGQQSYTYDAKDRLISVQKDAFSVSRDGNNTVLTFVGGARQVSGVSFAGTDPDAADGPGLCYTLSAKIDNQWTPITPLSRSGLSFTFASVLTTAVEITVDAGDHPGVSIATPST